MAKQVQKLEAFFKRRENSPNKDDGDDNTFGEYWEFEEPDQVELWSLELDPMTKRLHFIHKFKNLTVFLPISYIERVKDIFFECLGTMLIHRVRTIEEPYMFTICVDYSKSPFNLTIFLKSLENLEYEALMKEIEDQVDKKEWLNKEGFPLSARSMASKVRQIIVSLDILTTTNKSMS